MRTATNAITLALLSLLTACGGGGADPATPPAGTPDIDAGEPTADAVPTADADGGGEPAAVAISGTAFGPADVTVAPGGTVTWTNGDPFSHTVTFEDGGDSSETLAAGDTFERTFDTAGEFPYACTIHPQMTGTVTVA